MAFRRQVEPGRKQSEDARFLELLLSLTPEQKDILEGEIDRLINKQEAAGQ